MEFHLKVIQHSMIFSIKKWTSVLTFKYLFWLHLCVQLWQGYDLHFICEESQNGFTQQETVRVTKSEKQKIKFPAQIFTSAENKKGTENSSTNAVLGKKKNLKYNFCPIFIFSTSRIFQIGCLIFFFSIRKIWNALADFHYGKPILLYLLPSLFISWND